MEVKHTPVDGAGRIRTGGAGVKVPFLKPLGDSPISLQFVPILSVSRVADPAYR